MDNGSIIEFIALVVSIIALVIMAVSLGMQIVVNSRPNKNNRHTSKH